MKQQKELTGKRVWDKIDMFFCCKDSWLYFVDDQPQETPEHLRPKLCKFWWFMLISFLTLMFF